MPIGRRSSATARSTASGSCCSRASPRSTARRCRSRPPKWRCCASSTPPSCPIPARCSRGWRAARRSPPRRPRRRLVPRRRQQQPSNPRQVHLRVAVEPEEALLRTLRQLAAQVRVVQKHRLLDVRDDSLQHVRGLAGVLREIVLEMGGEVLGLTPGQKQRRVFGALTTGPRPDRYRAASPCRPSARSGTACSRDSTSRVPVSSCQADCACPGTRSLTMLGTVAHPAAAT